ncbi:MAG: hypothetical protein JSV54_07695 [Chloroflexota bacterium]|nr:MAG: hypothetical protein JSV54_07695 [Chloroflexota bacterium]
MRVFRWSSVIAVVILITATVLGSGCAAPPTEQAPPAPPPPKPNLTPVISSITVEPAELLYGESAKITCVATDPDYDPFEYGWSASDGVIIGTGNEVTWVAPDKDGNFNIAVTVTDSRGGRTTGNVMVAVSAPIKTITINPVASETGTVQQNNATFYGKTWAGDDAQNVGYRAFWSFDISPVAGKHVEKASLKFTTDRVMGKPFWYGPATGLGGLTLWKTTHGSRLPEFGYQGGKLSSTGSFFEPPTVIDVTTEMRVLAGWSSDRFQIGALFDRVSNGNNIIESIEWSSVVLEVTYSEK